MLCINVGEKALVEGRAALSICLLLEVTAKIGKAFNVMQYLSNHPIKIRSNQSLRPNQGFTAHSQQCCGASTHTDMH